MTICIVCISLFHPVILSHQCIDINPEMKWIHTSLSVSLSHGPCQNDRYVLPMLWWDSPLNLSCPVQTTTTPSPPILSALSALCLPYGVVMHMYGTEEDISKLGTVGVCDSGV